MFKKKVKNFRTELVEENKFTQIMPNIYLTGEMLTYYGNGLLSEQSLAIKAKLGLVVITGCSHPGIIKIIEKLKENLSEPVYLVIGGFHLMDKDERIVEMIIKSFRKLGVSEVCPSHCTGDKAIEMFKGEYKEDFIEIGAGKTIEV